jgi:Tol biopolymer transport system component
MRRTSRLLTVLSAASLLAAALPPIAASASPRPPGRILVLDVRPGQGLSSVRATGGDARHLGLSLPTIAYPDYSPDGTRIVYAEGQSVYTVDTTGGDRRWVIDGGSQPQYPRWAPYGTEIGVVTGELIAATVATPGFRVIFPSIHMSPYVFDWSPDGREVALVRVWCEPCNPDDTVWARDIWIVRADGSQTARQLTFRADTWDANRLAWSPDGRTLAVEALGDLWTVDVRSGAIADLTRTAGIVESSPIWSPDGRELAYGRRADATATPQVWLRPARGHSAGHPLGIAGEPTSWRQSG